jgi:hypothetical protein
MRCAKLSRGLGGGSLSSLMLVPGRPATGVTKRVDMSKYQTLSEEQKAKIQVCLFSCLLACLFVTCLRSMCHNDAMPACQVYAPVYCR